MSVLNEGVTAVPPASHVDDFNLREQVEGQTITAVTRDGVPVFVRHPSIEYGLVPEELIAADRTVGPNWRSLVQPIVASAIARVIAARRWDELDAAGTREAQARIISAAAAALARYHVRLISVELKEITPTLPLLASAATRTSVWEQRSLEARQAIEIARQNAEALREKASGIASANRSIAPELSDSVLLDKQNRAWRQLLTSPSTTVLESDDSSPVVEVSP